MNNLERTQERGIRVFLQSFLSASYMGALKKFKDSFFSEVRAAVTTPFFITYISIILAYFVVIFTLGNLWLEPIWIGRSYYADTMYTSLFFFLIAFLYFRFLWVLIVKKPKNLIKGYCKDIAIHIEPRRILYAATIVLTLPLFFSLFTSAKNMLTVYQPFVYDRLFTEMDAFIHGGVQPWEILYTLFGGTLVSAFILSAIYKTWFIVKFSFCFWQACSLGRMKLRERFFLSYLAIWIINGTILAWLLSSAGPCFYDNLFPGEANPYGALMDFLKSADEKYRVWELGNQEYLWAVHSGSYPGPLSGISAMPSMHVSVATLFMLTSWNINRVIGSLMTVFLILTMVGSVYLGWHYAVDGYLAAFTTFLIWIGVGRYVDWYTARRATSKAI